MIIAIPRGTIKELRYTSKALPNEHKASAPPVLGIQTNVASSQDVLAVRYTTPDEDEVYYLPNPGYVPTNPSLQFMANLGYKPSDFDGQRLDLRGENIQVPLARDDVNDMWAIHANVVQEGESALVNASWNEWDAEDLEEAKERQQQSQPPEQSQ